MILEFDGVTPTLGKDVFITPDATVLGRCTLGDEVNVWHGAVLRGDEGTITVGARTNIQDLSVVHVTSEMFDTRIGSDVTVGHRAILHGCTIGNHVLVGMGAIVLDGADVGDFCLIGAGALVPPGMKVPPGHVVLGTPGKIVRELREQERQMILASAPHYVELAARHRKTTRGVR